MEDNIKNIEQYCGWFNEKVDFVSSVKDDDIIILICCSLIDALAKCIYCDELDNNKRFINLLEKFGEARIWNRVSIYHLFNSKGYELIKQNKELDEYCMAKLSWVVDGEDIKCYDVDPIICEVQKKCDELNFPNKQRYILRKYKYSTIFYEHYRCGLVHEARITTEFSFDYCRKDIPYYAPYIDGNDNNVGKKHLIIPAKFVINSTKTIIIAVKEWLTKNNINPYERYGLT